MFKRILGVAICIATIASSVIPTYASEDIDWKTEVLTGLGIYQENPVTYDGFINSLGGFLYDNPIEMGDAETIARNTGMIESHEAYLGSDTLTIGEACKLAVITLGYKPAMGTDGNYMKKAAELGIADGIIAKGNDRLREDVAVNILYDMIDAAPLVRTYGSINGPEYVVANNKNLLSINRDIYVVKGIVTGTEITSLYGPEYTANRDCIAIDEVSYYIGAKRYDRLLGKNVIAYIQESDTFSDRILYVGEIQNRNKTVIIDCDDIVDIGDSISYITYYKNENTTKKVNIVASPRVIYNGMFLEDYDDKVDFQRGELELIDNNGDKVFDVIKISAYQNMVVEAIDSREMIIKNRYKFADCIEELNLNNQKDEDIIYRIYDSTGAEVDFSAIKTDDILSVLRSTDNKIIDVYISENNQVNGRVIGVDNNEKTVDVEGEKYKKSKDFDEFLTDTARSIEVGIVYTFAIDYFGRIAYMKEAIVNDYKVLVKIRYDDSVDLFSAEYMDMNGDWYRSDISEKVRIDGVKPGDYYAKMEDIRTGNDTVVLPQVVLIKFNSKNQIINIDTTVVTSDSKFSKKRTDGYKYSLQGEFFYSGTDVLCLENNTKVIVIPSTDKTNKEEWSILNAGSLFIDEQAYDDIDFFNLDEFQYTDLITVVRGPALSEANKSRALFVITGFKQSIVDGEVLPVIRGSVDGFLNFTFTGKTKDVFTNAISGGLSKGDVVNISLDQKGLVEKVDYLFSLSTFTNKNGGSGEININQKHNNYAGKVKDVDYEKGKLLIDCGLDDIPFKVDPNMQVTVYYRDENKCESKSFSAISRYTDEVYLRTNHGKVKEIVCVKD